MKRDRFTLFLASLIPGVGYMHLGLMKKGVEALGIYLLVKPLVVLVGLRGLVDIIRIPFWLYTFFSTYEIAAKQDSGTYVEDSDFIDFKKFNQGKNTSNLITILALVLISAGAIAILNNVFGRNEVYFIIKSYVRTYFFPVVLILTGIYMLFRNTIK